jgi:hypothetical protein
MFGGEGESQLFQDLHVFDANSNEWSEITGIDLPPARKDACMACNFPLFAIFGGTTVNGYDGDLYYIDLANNTVELLSNSEDSRSPGVRAHGACWAYPLASGDTELMVAIGETIGEASLSTIYTYSLLRREWRLTGETESRSQIAAIKANDRLLFAGGERWGFNAYKDVFSFDLKSKTTTHLGQLPKSFNNGGFCYVKTSLYMQGGADTSTWKLRPFIPSTSFFRIEMNEDCESQGCAWPCSAGTYQVSSGKCEFCPQGTYNSDVGASQCVKCPKGTASKRLGNSSIRQCYPCSENFYTPVEGTSRCLMCPNGYSCSIGNSEPQASKSRVESIKSMQPKSYSSTNTDVNQLILTVQVNIAVICVLVSCFYCVANKQNLFAKIDLYKKLHNHVVDEPMYRRATGLGGLFTVMFVLIALFFIFSALITFSLENIEETKALVPMVTLESDFDKVMTS